ncbi:MAG: hypothetical protein LBV13_03535 [Methanomassiliicoccaceae archaeon]|jgi:hypothetical protein|nr:hypothetical protein [Methanomassiliicoccaceae archaeon]
MSENRVDPTVAGLFLVGFITLFFGLLGINLYGDSTDSGLLLVAFDFIGVIGILMVMFSYMAGKAGNAYATALFAFIAVALFGVSYGAGAGDNAAIVFYALALFFVVFALVGAMIGAPKMLVILLLLVALLYLFVGFFFSGSSNVDVWALMFGIFGLLSFLLATYMAVGLGTQKLPVF